MNVKGFTLKAAFAGLAICIALFYSCKDEELDLSYSLLPEGELLKGNDTLLRIKAISKEMADYSAHYDLKEYVDGRENLLPQFPFGSVDDPNIGKYKIHNLWNCIANVYSDQAVDTGWFNFKGKIRLQVSNMYTFGDTMSLKYNIYKFTSEFPDKSDSTSTFNIEDKYDVEPISTEPIGNNTRNYFVDYDGNGDPTHIDIPLSDDYVDEILSQIIISKNGKYDTIKYDSIKTKIFNYYLQPEIASDKGGILNYNIYNRNSYNGNYSLTPVIEFTYDRIDTIQKDPLELDTTTHNLFTIVPTELFYNVEKEYNPTVLNAINNDVPNSHLAYLQSIYGIESYLTIDSVYSFVKNNPGYLINRAEVVLPVEENFYDTDKYKLPGVIGIKKIDTEGERDWIIDIEKGIVGGGLDTVRKAYVINITGHVIDMMSYDSLPENGDKFVIYTINNNYENNKLIMSRAAFPTGDDASSIHLKVIYSLKPEN